MQLQVLTIGLTPIDPNGCAVNLLNNSALIADGCIAATDACVLEASILVMAADDNDTLLGLNWIESS